MAFLIQSRRHPGPGVGRRVWLAWLLLLLTTFASGGAAEPSPSREYKVKAVFLFNFAQFVEWPDNAFPDLASPFVIGILGEDPFSTYLEDLVRGEKVGARAISIVRFRCLEEVNGCQILYVSRSEDAQLRRVIEQVRTQPTLTVSDAERFANLGGMIQFFTEASKIRLKINVGAAKASNLTISSKLLRPSLIVTTEH